MRVLFLLLIGINLVYFGWNYNQRETQEDTVPSLVEPGITPIRMLHEDPNLSAEAIAAGKASQCYTLGPFKTVSAAKELEHAIAGRGISVKRRAIDEQQKANYWVYLPPLKSRDAALEISRNLASKGVKDYFIVTADENKNAISLGVFSKQEGAQRRYKEMSQMGYAPKLDVRHRNQTLYWLDYREAPGKRLPSNIWQTITKHGVTVQRVARRCV